MRQQTATALAGIAVSLAISILAWWYLGTLLLFLFVPFVPFFFSWRSDPDTQSVRTCPRCGFQTTNEEYEFCPRDGERLRETETDDPW